MKERQCRPFRRIGGAAVVGLALLGPVAEPGNEQHSSHLSGTTISQVGFENTDRSQYLLDQPLNEKRVQLKKDAVSELAQVPAPGLQDTTVISGLDLPTNVVFAPDGGTYVAEKSGVIKRFGTVAGGAPTIAADLSERVNSYWDRGLIGLEIDPRDPDVLYALYTKDAPPGIEPPVYNDTCADPNGSCVVDGELDRITLDPDTHTMTDREVILIDRFPQQFPSHSVGSVKWGPDDDLMVSAGDGASFTALDYGQFPSTPPMGELPNEGGALRSQTDGTLDGKITSVNPDTGETTVLSHGLRNPFRFDIRPGTNEIWSGDVGWVTWEEINRDVSGTENSENFGWPCFEGGGPEVGYDGANLPICETLYSGGGHVPPFFAYPHEGKSAAISGLAFNTGDKFLPEMGGALFFGDYGRQNIYAMLAGADGVPDPGQIVEVANGVNPVELKFGPDGYLYYPDIIKGEIHKLGLASHEPTAIITIPPEKTYGPLPFAVTLDCNLSTDPDPDDVPNLQCEWDTDDDGTYDRTGRTVSVEYTKPENVKVSLKVTDPSGLTDIAKQTLWPGNTPPVPTIIVSPGEGEGEGEGEARTPGEEVAFHGTATDAEEGEIPEERQSWRITLNHCPAPTSCHEHPLLDVSGDAGDFIFPEHGDPLTYYVTVAHTATDERGLSATARATLFKRTPVE